jgi:hypothetical protein
MKKGATWLFIITPLIITLLVAVFAFDSYNFYNNSLQQINNAKPNEKSFACFYPITDIPPIIENGDSVSLNTTVIYVTLKWNGTLVEGTPVILTAYGQLSSRDAPTTSNVIVGFIGAKPYSEDQTIIVINPFSGVVFLKKTTALPYNNIALSTQQTTILWDTQGDYSAQILLVNSSSPNNTVQKYDFQSVHVGSADIIEQQKDELLVRATEKTNITLTFAIIALTIMQSAYLIFDHLPKKEEKKNGLKICDIQGKELCELKPSDEGNQNQAYYQVSQGKKQKPRRQKKVKSK